MSDDAPKWRRLLRIPAHGLATYRVISKLIAECSSPTRRCYESEDTLSADRALPDLIFVPTVLVHHLAGWLPLMRRKLRNVPTRVLLFFPNTPLEFDAHGNVRLAREPTAKLFRWYIRRFAREVASGKVVLGAETRPMTKALTEVTGVPFTYLPHPVESAADLVSASRDYVYEKSKTPLFGAYGAARADKGSDLLQKAIRQLLEESPEIQARFALQWITDFQDEHGNTVKCDPWLKAHPKVTVIDEYFAGEEYREQFSKTDVLILPYSDQYRLRVSRVLIEALVLGKPVVTTCGTTLCQQGAEFGAVIPFEGRVVKNLVKAIKLSVADFSKYEKKALAARNKARAHFSVAGFRDSFTR